MTPQDLETQIAEARKQMEICWEHGEKTQARKWAAELRELIAERCDSERLSTDVER